MGRTRTAMALVMVVAALVASACSKSDGGSQSAAPTTKRTTNDTTEFGTVGRDDSLKLNQIQVVGTHNSYHQAATGKEHQLLVDMSPEQAATRTYSHPKLETQL